MKLKLCGVVCVLAFLSALPARADGGAPVYDVSGTIVFTGNAGQTETITFDFDLALQVCGDGCFGRGPYIPEVIGTPIISGIGPLGTPYIGSWEDYEDFVYFGDAEGDEIDLKFGPLLDSEVVPTNLTGEIYRCYGAVCADQFNVIDPGNPYYPGGANYGATAATITDITQTPEPPTLALLCLGVLGVGLLRRHA